MWACAIAERYNFFPTQVIYPPGLNGALHVSEPKAATAVGAEGKHLCKEGQPVSARGGGDKQKNCYSKGVISETADEQGLEPQIICMQRLHLRFKQRDEGAIPTFEVSFGICNVLYTN